MNRTPAGPRRSPGAPRPASDWTFPGVRSPFGGSPQRRGAGFSPRFCPGFSRGTMDGSPAHFSGESRGFGVSVGRGSGFRRPQSFSPPGAPNLQLRDVPVERYFSPSMLQDPWRTLQPVTPEAAARTS
ncbi:M-phase-specific PLK1-interacting protein isoform X2 [Xiphophorus maculatus]|uniref:M-phase-specific PLK1-interacting protein isoform X2 n=1 Tax=Xiphophorus maculatus TaxID=8083 RepID=UPI000C6EEB78|nr:M-phase-specific PLK1-interacting protein isoform X2 [Xiphophorus maculatus]XP_027877051.1 M-phase-specific PLK1-interacting protein isoform X2 [Xiphophorus couchianus]XP_032421900.1 M-phase-specific PLK1-interacting protein isoform X2 [Xiphophorus hellerii]